MSVLIVRTTRQEGIQSGDCKESRSGGSEGGVENSVFADPLTMDDLEHMSPEQNIEMGCKEDE